MAIILASTSTIRRQLLINAGIEHQTRRPNLDEEDLKRLNLEFTPHQLAQYLAAAKCVSISDEELEHVVIGADQVLSLGTKIFNKPGSVEEARFHLMELSGSTHTLTSAICCARAGVVMWSYRDEAKLTMRPLSKKFVETYLELSGDEVISSVGAYKLEGLGIQLFEEIKGDYFTILGLPLIPLLSFLRSAGEIPV